MRAEDDFDLGELARALDRAAPRPDPALRAAHLALARDVFDRLHGATAPARVAPEAPRRDARPRGLLSALFSPGGMATATAAVAGVVLVLTPAGRGLIERPLAREETARTEAPTVGEEALAEAEPEAAAPGAARMAEAPDDVASAAPTAGEAGPDAAATMAAPTETGTMAEAPAPEAASGPGADASRVTEAPEAAPAEEEATALAAPEVTALAPPPAVGGAAPEGVAPRPLEELADDLVAAAPLARAAPEDAAAARPGAAAAPAEGGLGALVRALREGRLPRPEEVPLGAVANAVAYDLPLEGATGALVLPAPWDPEARLVLVALGREVPEGARDLRLEVAWDAGAVSSWLTLLPLHAEPGGVAAAYEVRPGEGASLGRLTLRWKPPAGGGRGAVEAAIPAGGPVHPEAGLAAALLGWGLILRGEAPEGWTVAEAQVLARAALGREGRGAEVLELMALSEPLLR